MVRELAQSLGIDQALVCKVESGNRKPTQEQLKQLAHILDYSHKNNSQLLAFITRYVSSNVPTGGQNGDIWYQVANVIIP